jgi:hypothetical protein
MLTFLQITLRRRMPSGGKWRRVDLVWLHLLTLVVCSRAFLPRRLRRYVPPKRQFTLDLHSATSQKTAFFTVIAVKTSNLTYFTNVCMECLILETFNIRDAYSVSRHHLTQFKELPIWPPKFGTNVYGRRFNRRLRSILGLKATTFWNVMPCSAVKNESDNFTVSICRAEEKVKQIINRKQAARRLQSCECLIESHQYGCKSST